MRFPLALLLAALTVSPAYADVIDFTTLNKGPSQTIVIDGVTILAGSGYSLDEFRPGGLVSIVAGLGLGYGTDGSIDKAFVYADAGSVPAGPNDGTFAITVDGRINSITVQSYFMYQGPSLPDDVNTTSFAFPMLAVGPCCEFGAYWTGARMSNNATATITFGGDPNGGVDYRPTTLLEIGNPYDPYKVMLYDLYWVNYGAVSFRFGTSITSIDYTPNRVPEPATLGLLAIGALCLLRRHGVAPS